MMWCSICTFYPQPCHSLHMGHSTSSPYLHVHEHHKWTSARMIKQCHLNWVCLKNEALDMSIIVYQFVYRYHSSEHPHRQSHHVSLQVELPSRGQFSRRCRQHRWKAAQWEVVSFWTLRSSATRGPLLEPWTRWNVWHVVGCDGHGLLRSLLCLFMTRENLLHHYWMILCMLWIWSWDWPTSGYDIHIILCSTSIFQM